MPSFTPIFNLAKPFVADAIDEDLWGGYLNDNFDKIEDALKISRDMDTAVKTADYAVLDADRNSLLLANATGGNIIFTLPDAAIVGDGYKVFFKKTDASTNTVTIDGYMSQTVDGVANKVLTAQYNYIGLVCDGTNWNVLFETPVSIPQTQLARAWGTFDASSGSISGFLKQYGCSGVSYSSVGTYVITLSTPMSDNNYVVTCNGSRGSGTDAEMNFTYIVNSSTQFTIYSRTDTSNKTNGKVGFVVHGER